MEELEIIKIEGNQAILSYRLTEIPEGDLNNGYRHMTIPYNLREIQLSSRGNVLVDQSVKDECVVANHPGASL